jgi:DNA-binding response OmpR family regulator
MALPYRSGMPKLLLVTDADWVANEVTAALGVGDWNIELLTDPALAAEKVTTGYYHAAVVDMQVASMGGMAVIRAIRQATAGRHRPRLVLLLDRVADRFIAKRAGADAAVLKPLNAAGLRRALGAMPAVVGTREEE